MGYFYLFENSEHRSKKKYFIFIFSKTSELETNAFKKKNPLKVETPTRDGSAVTFLGVTLTMATPTSEGRAATLWAVAMTLGRPTMTMTKAQKRHSQAHFHNRAFT